MRHDWRFTINFVASFVAIFVGADKQMVVNNEKLNVYQRSAYRIEGS